MTRQTVIWDEHPDTITGDQLIVEFWTLALGWTFRRFEKEIGRRNNFDANTVEGIIIDTLMKFGRTDYWQWLERIQEQPQTKRLFWALLKKRLVWAIQDHLGKKTDYNETIEDRDDDEINLAWMRTQFTHHVDHSTLHRELCNSIEQLPAIEQTLLALYFFEDLRFDQIASVIGGGPVPHDATTQASIRLHRVTARFLRAALERTLPDRLDPAPPQPQTQWRDTHHVELWVQEQYGVPLSTYAHYVGIHYRADVRYLTDMLDHANNIRRRKPNVNPRPRSARAILTDDQVRDIRARSTRGETQVAIAAVYGIAATTVSGIVHRHKYRDVEDAA